LDDADVPVLFATFFSNRIWLHRWINKRGGVAEQ
jgi:hypothetical protein